jgi:hypothetical protein
MCGELLMSYLGRHKLPDAKTVAGSSVVIALATGIVAVAGMSSAYAYIKNGTGTDTKNASIAAAKTVSISNASVSGALFPGGKADLVVTVTDPYSNLSMTVTRANLAAAASGTGGTGICTTTGISVIQQSNITPSATITAGGQATITLVGAVSMDATSDKGCQNATFTVPVTVTTQVG